MPKNEALPTQDFVEIDRIEGDVLILKTGGLRKILLVSGVNVELKSEEEQNLIHLEYQNFLNSLDFSLQIIIHSRKLNIDKYLKLLEAREAEEADELLKNEVSEYREFVRSFVADNDIMTKNFFVVVPYDPTIASSGNLSGLLPPLPFGKKPSPEKAKEAAETSDEVLQKNIFQLNQRVDHVAAGLRALGVRAVALNKEELIELFYNLYNPETVEKQDMSIAKNA